jgi:hypothetical protein
MRLNRTRRRLAVVALGACAALLAVTGGSPAAAAPEAVNGHFDLASASGPECDSPFGVCMTGTVSGRIKGSFSFTVREVLATDDTPTTGAIVTAGDATVDTGAGTILCKLTGTLQLNGDGPFVSLCVITGGTGRWAGVTGYLRTSGTFTLDGGGSGSYDGKVVGG